MGVWWWRVPPCRVSHAVEKICHRFLVRLVGLEAISEASGHLAIELRGFGQITALVEDLLSVGVVVGLFHAVSLQGQQALSERCSDSLPTGPCSRAA